jgi:hypothetical protein
MLIAQSDAKTSVTTSGKQAFGTGGRIVESRSPRNSVRLAESVVPYHERQGIQLLQAEQDSFFEGLCDLLARRQIILIHVALLILLSNRPYYSSIFDDENHSKSGSGQLDAGRVKPSSVLSQR